MDNKALINKYRGYLSTIMSSLDFVEDEEGEYDLKTVTRTAKVATVTIKKCNEYLESEQISNDDKKYWEALKVSSFSLISELTGVITSVLAQAKISGSIWQLLYCYEVCSSVIDLLYNERIKEEGGKEIITNTLTPEQLEQIYSVL